MRLFNFSIVSSQKTVSNLVTTSGLVISGVVGEGVTSLNRADRSGNMYSFVSHHSEDDEDPYGNANLYNVARVNTSTAMEVTQSFSAPITGSATADFIFITMQ